MSEIEISLKTNLYCIETTLNFFAILKLVISSYEDEIIGFSSEVELNFFVVAKHITQRILSKLITIYNISNIDELVKNVESAKTVNLDICSYSLCSNKSFTIEFLVKEEI